MVRRTQEAGHADGRIQISEMLPRPDQIWLKRLSAVSSYAVRTAHSDHRMVVTDVLLNLKE